ncbi:GNAT family N-acetyltransferase [Deinococcus saxicola]|uniref:GNAT family N-acetyltransferase n=1 Tax=Deinococcus saxicola TaxID=249406 RepID=UPI0039EE5A73
MTRPATSADFERIHEIIDDAAQAYRGIITADRWHEPYMPREELGEQIADGVELLCFEDGGEVTGVMGIRDRDEVKRIRHAYVATRQRNVGIGSKLLRGLPGSTDKPVLIGTWAVAK